MLLTKEQISEQMCKHAQKKNGLHDLMEIMLESMMVAERSEFLVDNPGNKGNGYRPGSAYGHGRKLQFRIPRDRYGNFHPQILAILRDQEEECDRLAGVLYTKGLTQEQVGDVFDQIYGQHYSKTSISRMVDSVRDQVNEWLERGLEKYYPILFVDCVHIKIHRKRSVASEAFYVALAVTEEGTREVLGVFNMPIESAAGWKEIFGKLQERGVQRIGIVVADGIKDYRSIKLLRNNADYKAYMTYLNYAPQIQSMIYTTNWIERLNRDFRRVTRMRIAMPNEESVLTLMGSVAMDHNAYDRLLPNITYDMLLFPE